MLDPADNQSTRYGNAFVQVRCIMSVVKGSVYSLIGVRVSSQGESLEFGGWGGGAVTSCSNNNALVGPKYQPPLALRTASKHFHPFNLPPSPPLYHFYKPIQSGHNL